jgi:hypothetical protein
MIFESFYLSDKNNLSRALDMTGLALDELESIVGYFTKTSWRHGQMRGEVVVKLNGEIVIRHHFTKKKLWKGEHINENFRD